MKITIKVLALVITVLTPFISKAEILSRSESHFHIKFEVELPQSVSTTYDQFLNIGEWWQSSHTWFGDASKLFIETKAGGCFCEVNGDKEALHMTVAHVNPGKSLKMLGGLGPLQGMGVNGVMSWDFSQLEENKTKLTLNYSVKGFTTENVQTIAEAVNKVLATQVNELKKKLQ
ncbi:SRPBCC family protein [Kangiella sediminilitoris]|uniref:Activator of Hsp90 ATPase 1 family protein n=1 Tax=Kangiella sediminilitoris TaxID=1144748 RepID=A0A1B3B9T2_9GAMM|nr:activator of HSP90 ATPase [Kangiella sediminilitoris]AOE49559.1 Activator of Hsp90 ATPase 1 family protein [Kangiella sediminilitoris]